MADLSDVLDTLTSMVSEAVYPNGTGNPSVTGGKVSIFPGWPVRNKLDDAMRARGEFEPFVSVFPTNIVKDVTKYERTFQQTGVILSTITTRIVGETVLIEGTVSIPSSVVIIADGIAYGYKVLSTDTLDSIAQSLSFLIPGSIYGANGVTIPGVRNLVSRVTNQAIMRQRLGMEQRVFMISCWCPTPVIRTILGSAINVYIRSNYQPVFSDGFYGFIWYESLDEDDDLQLSLVYRRNLNFRVQYQTTYEQKFTTITYPYVNLNLE